MAANSPNKEAAIEVAKFWVGQPQNAQWTDISGLLPVRDDAIANGYGTHMPQQTIDTMGSISAIRQPLQPFPKFTECQNVTNASWTKALTGELTAEAAMDECAQGVQTIVFG